MYRLSLLFLHRLDIYIPVFTIYNNIYQLSGKKFNTFLERKKLMLPAVVLFAVTYVLMLTFSKYRPYIALTSGLIFILTGMLPLGQIIPALDFNVLLMIGGTMGLVQLFIDSRIEEAHALMLSLLDSDDIREDICFDAMDIYADYDYFDELLEFVAKAETVLPDSKDLLREIAAICEERMEYEQAVVFYNKLIDKDPYSLSDWFSLAKVEALLKHYDKAIEACDFALAVKENDESILSFKGYCYSVLREFTGLSLAIRRVSRMTQVEMMPSTIMLPIRKVGNESGTFSAKFSSHFWPVTRVPILPSTAAGSAIHSTFRMTIRMMSEAVAPLIFRMAISLLRREVSS